VRRALFSAQVYTEKGNSGVIEITPDAMVVVRVGKVTPKHIQPLAKATAFIRDTLLNERAMEAAAKAGEAALAADRQKTDAAVPEGFGTSLTISRVNAQGVEKAVLDAAFNVDAHKLSGYAGVKGPQGYVLIRVEKSQPGKPDSMMASILPLQLGQAQGRAEEAAVLRAMKSALGVKMLPEAEKAIAGDTPDQG